MRDLRLRWVLLGYAVLTLALTYPLLFRLTELMLEAGAGEDAYIFIWNIWWMKKALFELHTNPYVTDVIFYPDGTNLALHTFPVGCTIPGAILSYVKPGLEGLIAGYNGVVLLSFFLTALGTYLLVRRITGSSTAAFVAGVAFAFTHYRFSNTVRLHCMETGVLSFSAWAAVCMVQEKKIRRGALVGVFAALALYASKEYFAQLLIGFLLAAIYLTIAQRSLIWTRSMLRPKLAAAGVFIILSLPILIALGSHGLGAQAKGTAHAAVFSADLLDPLVPNPRHPLFGDWSVAFERGMHGGVDGFGLALPLVALILSIWAVVTGDRRRTWPWAGLGILYFFLSLGPTVHLGGHETAIPSLYRGLSAVLPWLEISRTPMRFVVGMQLAVAVLVGFALMPGPGAKAGRNILSLAIGGLLVFEILSIPLSTTPVSIHPYYRVLADHPTEGAVLELPPRDRMSLLHQTVHGRKIPAVRRAYPRSPDWSLSFWESAELRDFLDTLFRSQRIGGLSPDAMDLLASKHRRFLTTHGIRFVTVAKQEIPPQEREQALLVLRDMSPQRVFEDDDLAVFEF